MQSCSLSPAGCKHLKNRLWFLLLCLYHSNCWAKHSCQLIWENFILGYTCMCSLGIKLLCINMRTNSKGRVLQKEVESKEGRKQETPLPRCCLEEIRIFTRLTTRQIHWVTRVKSQTVHLLQIQGKKEILLKGWKQKHIFCITRSGYCPLMPDHSGKHFLGFSAIISFSAESAKMFSSFSSPQMDAGTPRGLVSSYILKMPGQCRS